MLTKVLEKLEIEKRNIIYQGYWDKQIAGFGRDDKC